MNVMILCLLLDCLVQVGLAVFYILFVSYGSEGELIVSKTTGRHRDTWCVVAVSYLVNKIH